MLKKFTIVTVLVGAAMLFEPLVAQQSQAVAPKPHKQNPRLSPHETIYQRIGTNNQNSSLVTLVHGRPYSAKGGKGEVRKIWGGLVPWGKADRMGSDEATTLITQHPLVFGSTTIPAGAHVLYIVPSETGPSKLAFSTNIGKWGIPVDEKHDVARVDLTKQELSERVDQLTLAIDNTTQPGGDWTGVIRIMWENTQFSAPFTVQH